MKNNKYKNKPLIIIPSRMGSKRLKFKNILPIKKLPMFVFVAKKYLNQGFHQSFSYLQSREKFKKFASHIILIL